jgi:hypothetical protein
MADELYGLLEGYRFRTEELSEFVRGLFRADWAREQEEVEACMKSFVGSHPGAVPKAVPVEDSGPELITIEPTGATHNAPDPSELSAPTLEDPPAPGEERRGLWARLTGKFKK